MSRKIIDTIEYQIPKLHNIFISPPRATNGIFFKVTNLNKQKDQPKHINSYIRQRYLYLY